MGKTYKWTDLLTSAGSRYPKMLADNYGAMQLDRVNSMIWADADWRVALVDIEPFYLQPLEQDYAAPSVVIPSDFDGLRYAVVLNAETTPATRYEPSMTVDRYLRLTSLQDRPNAISYEPSINGWRVHPRPPSGLGPMTWMVEGSYKKQPTKVTASTLANTLPFDDQYLDAYFTGLDWLFSKSPNDAVLFQAALSRMASHEAVNLGQQAVSPREALVHW